MSAPDPVIALRPHDSTAAAITAAIDRARTALADAEASVATSRQDRDAALLDADAKTLALLERKLTDARTVATDVAERVGSVLRQLEARLITTKRAEALARLDHTRTAAEDAGSALADWWAANESHLAALLREGERLDTSWGNAQSDWQRTAAETAKAYPDEMATPPQPTGNPAAGWLEQVVRMGEPVPRIRDITPDPFNVEQEAAREAIRAKATADYAERQPHGKRQPATPAIGDCTMTRPLPRSAPVGSRFQMLGTVPVRMSDAADGPNPQPAAPSEPAPADTPPVKVAPTEAEEAEGITPKPPVVPPADPDAPPAEPAPDAATIFARMNGRPGPVQASAAKPTAPAGTLAAAQAIYSRMNTPPRRP